MYICRVVTRPASGLIFYQRLYKLIDFISRVITVLCHFRKKDIMPVIICKNDKHLVTLYNIIFSNMTGIQSYLSDIFY